jgi:hypothetical protein
LASRLSARHLHLKGNGAGGGGPGRGKHPRAEGVWLAARPGRGLARVASSSRSGPEGGGASTSQGHPRTVFRRALTHGNLIVAEASARELGRLSLDEALELTILIAQKEPARLPRVAVRWLERFIQERRPTLGDVALAVAGLAGLTDEHRAEAIRVLRSLGGAF